MPFAFIQFLDPNTGRPVDPGYGQQPGYGGGHPSQGLPGGGNYPSTGPIYPGGHPGGGPVHPGGSPDPGWGIPEGGRPDNGLPAPPEVTPSPPQGDMANKIIVAVYTPQRGWTCRMYEPGQHPDHGLPGGPPGHVGGGPVYPPQGPTDPGYGQGHPMPPHVGGGPMPQPPPGYVSGQPVPPGGQPPHAGQLPGQTPQPRR